MSWRTDMEDTVTMARTLAAANGSPYRGTIVSGYIHMIWSVRMENYGLWRDLRQEVLGDD